MPNLALSRGALSHVAPSGRAQMVDVADKPETHRMARAIGAVKFQKSTLDKIIKNQIKKGDVLAIARFAGIAAAKRTSELIPLCHPLRISSVEVEAEVDKAMGAVKVAATVRGFDRTGFEMEAMTAAATAALTLYDMCKAADPTAIISQICLAEKQGGKSGHWRRPA